MDLNELFENTGKIIFRSCILFLVVAVNVDDGAILCERNVLLEMVDYDRPVKTLTSGISNHKG